MILQFEETHNPVLESLAFLLLPLFPLALLLAVLRENFTELGGTLQRLITYALTAVASLNVFILALLLFFRLSSPAPGTWKQMPFGPHFSVKPRLEGSLSSDVEMRRP